MTDKVSHLICFVRQYNYQDLDIYSPCFTLLLTGFPSLKASPSTRQLHSRCG